MGDHWATVLKYVAAALRNFVSLIVKTLLITTSTILFLSIYACFVHAPTEEIHDEKQLVNS